MAILDNIKKTIFGSKVNNAREEAVEKKLFGFIISNQRDNNYYFTTQAVENEDLILAKADKTIAVYRELLYDEHIKSCIQSRKSGILSQKWIISEYDDSSEVFEFINKCLTDLNMYSLLSAILDAPLFGFQFNEIIWTVKDNKIVPSSFVSIEHELIGFNKNGMPIAETENSSTPVDIPHYKYLLTQYENTRSNPYGVGILSQCYHPYRFKRGAMKLYAEMVHKYGLPLVYGTYDASNEQNRVAFTSILQDLHAEMKAVIPEGLSLNVLDPVNDTGEIFINFIKLCETAISKAILSQTLTTQQDDTGSYAMSKTHNLVREDVIAADKMLVEQTMNELIKLLCVLNFGDLNAYPKFILYNETDVDMNLAQRDSLLAEKHGLEFADEYFIREYGYKQGDFTRKVVTTPTPLFKQFDEGEEGHTHDDETNADALSKLPIEKRMVHKFDEEVISKIRSLYDNEDTDIDKIEKEILKLIPGIKDESIGELLTQVFNVSYLAGNDDAE